MEIPWYKTKVDKDLKLSRDKFQGSYRSKLEKWHVTDVVISFTGCVRETEVGYEDFSNASVRNSPQNKNSPGCDRLSKTSRIASDYLPEVWRFRPYCIFWLACWPWLQSYFCGAKRHLTAERRALFLVLKYPRTRAEDLLLVLQWLERSRAHNHREVWNLKED